MSESEMTVEDHEKAVADAEAALAAAKAAAAHQPFPKWLKPHPSHLIERPAVGDSPAHWHAPEFPDPPPHKDRLSGDVLVFVKDLGEELKAIAERSVPKAGE